MITEPMVESLSGFHGLSLSPPVLAALERANYTEPTPIQTAFIPEAIQGRDVIGQAQTGTGKTAAFLLPFFNGWKPNNRPGPEAIILAPTRELVVQVSEEAAKLSPARQCRTLAIYGGQRIRKQLNDLEKGCAVVVGTPGRVLDHLSRGSLTLAGVRYVVLDEADRMLDIGFRPDIERILRRCPQPRQTMLLSATMPPPVMRLVSRYMVDPIHINVAPERATVQSIRQLYFSVEERHKFNLLLRVLEREQVRQCIIFCERKIWAEDIYLQLREHVRRAAVIHGDLDQSLRNRIMQGFRDGKITYLVATDVVGRGIDVRNISHVINYDLPEDAENYVHRIGRTGRIGADGIAIAFVTPEQGKQLTAIELFINQQIEEDTIDGLQTTRKKVRAHAVPDSSDARPAFNGRPSRFKNRL